jgi:hypothetical protein
VIQDFPDDEGFGVAPGLVVVAAEGHQFIEDNIAGFHVDDVELCPLYERAHLVEARDQQIAGACRLRLVKQLSGFDVADRTGAWRTIEDGASNFSARHQIGAQRSFEFAQAPDMVGALVDDFARGVDILDFRDCEDGRLGLRPTLRDRTGATDGCDGQSNRH